MLSKITTIITDLDIFAFNPERALSYKNKLQFPTFQGGCLSVSYFLIISAVWYYELYTILTFGNNTNSSNTTLADLELAYTVSDLNSFPVYKVMYRGTNLPEYHEKTCQEFNGDCLQFAQKYLDMSFI